MTSQCEGTESCPYYLLMSMRCCLQPAHQLLLKRPLETKEEENEPKKNRPLFVLIGGPWGEQGFYYSVFRASLRRRGLRFVFSCLQKCAHNTGSKCCFSKQLMCQGCDPEQEELECCCLKQSLLNFFCAQLAQLRIAGVYCIV